jgi:hypothetical protein
MEHQRWEIYEELTFSLLWRLRSLILRWWHLVMVLLCYTMVEGGRPGEQMERDQTHPSIRNPLTLQLTHFCSENNTSIT